MAQTQWIILDKSPDNGEDDAENAAYNRAIENMKLLGAEYKRFDCGTSDTQCYNDSLGMIKGEFVNFTNEHIRYDRNILFRVKKGGADYLDSALFAVGHRLLKTDENGNLDKIPFNIFAAVSPLTKKEQTSETMFIRYFFNAYFIRTAFLRGFLFTEPCAAEAGITLVFKLLRETGGYIYLRGAFCYYDSLLSRRSSNYYGCSDKNFYIESLENTFAPMIAQYAENGENIPVWTQKFVYYQLYFKFYSNLNLRNHYLLDAQETNEFFRLAGDILKYIDDDIIMGSCDYAQFAPPFMIRNLFMYLKYDGDIDSLERSFALENGALYYYQRGSKYDLSGHQDIKIMAFNVKGGFLSVDARFFTNLLYVYAPDSIYACMNGKKYNCLHTGVYAHDKIFGVSVEKSYTFKVSFPLNEVKKAGTEIAFYLELGDECVKLPLHFNRAPSKLNENCPSSFWMFSAPYALEYSNGGLRTVALTQAQAAKRNKKFTKEAVAKIKATASVCEKWEGRTEGYVSLLRKIRADYYNLKHDFDGRRIWIFFDKLFKAGDNGEYLFRYAEAREKQDGIECYYIVNDDCPDYPRLKEEFGDKILVFNSHKCRLYGLMAENIIATHPDIIEFLGFDTRITPFVKDLFNPGLICIAHGITIQKNADYQNRLFDNTMFYTTSSKYEVNHILKPIYGYDRDEIALTGMARFDGLKNNDKKQILITPTWRRSLVGTAKRNTTREYAGEFKKTSYFKIYNSLINDKRLIETARKHAYRVIFLLHPSMSAQIDDYDRNDYVELIQASGDMNYEKILTQSSLMVTDYSGIHYDFGYMRKPVIYYQPKEVPMRFEEGGMKFATMGFGPVCTEYEHAVKLICEYIENNCKMPEEYKRRADDFFAFDDYNNCARIYSAVAEWTERRVD